MQEFLLFFMAPLSSIDSLVVGSAANGSLVRTVRTETQVVITPLAA
jgi:hypothetical protein